MVSVASAIHCDRSLSDSIRRKTRCANRNLRFYQCHWIAAPNNNETITVCDRKGISYHDFSPNRIPRPLTKMDILAASKNRKHSSQCPQ